MHDLTDFSDDLARFKERLRQLEAATAKVKTMINALVGEELPEVPTAGAFSPYYDIVAYLREQGRPMHQADIIRHVGQKRKELYPFLETPFNDIWVSLKYQDKHNGDYVCVKVEGDKIVRAELKPHKRVGRVKGGHAIDRPELYGHIDNYFCLKDKMTPLVVN